MSVEKVKFRTGIDTITYQETGADKSYVSAKKTLHPTIGKTPSHVRDLFDPHNSYDTLEEFVRPRITTWLSLIPARFKLLRKQIFKSLKSKVCTNSNDAEKIALAAELLEDEMANVNFFEQSLHALIKV